MNHNTTLMETHKPSYHEIAARAHQLFQHRGGHHGNDVQDWLQAESELLHLACFQPTPVPAAKTTKSTLTKPGTLPRRKRPIAP